MKRSIFFFTLSLIFIPVTAAFAEDIIVDSKIIAATVYNDRAAVKREGKVKIPSGAHNIVFKGIPVSIYPDSLRAEGSSVANVVFGAVSHKRESFEDYVVPREKELNDKLKTLQDKRRLEYAEKQALASGKTFLDNLAKQASLRENEEIAKMELNTESWSGAVDVIFTKIAENLKADIAQDIKIRDIDDEINKINNELRELRTGQKQSFEVTLPFESDKAAELTVSLIYQIPSVSWQPVYDARLDVKSGKLNLVQYGSVGQLTGEDWEDVALTLSTARPSRGAGLPDLEPQWVSLYENMPMKGRGYGDATPAYIMAVEEKNEDSLERAITMGSSAIPVPEAPKAKEASFQSAQIDTGGFVSEYKITGPSTVKADGTKAKLLVGSFEVDNKLQIQIKPKFGTDAYLVAMATLKGEAPILPGQVNLFRDGAYIGQSYTKMLRPGDETNLAFGIDDNVVVTRNTLKDERSEAGLISKESQITRSFVTEIKNLHKEPVEIALLDNVPVSKDERIRVEVLKDETTQGYQSDVDDKKGVLQWVKKYKPSEEIKINLGWRVSWPKDQNISGL
ncbi:MAG: mucoidy inhibitor MuiA family protein [Alphaproteobacteria bacterium]|nr:mucoidy inhibitor MuiA family protein [Alphaproteobacteria bacterium]